MAGVVSIAVPGVFLIAITPLSLLFLLFLTIFLPGFVSLSLTGRVAPGGMFATAEAIRIIRGRIPRIRAERNSRPMCSAS